MWLLGLALAARLAVWLGGCWHPAALLTPDSHDYVRLAGGLAHGQFGEPGRPEIFRVPGYPVFLSVVGLVSKSPAWVCLIQALLDVVTCALVWRLGRRVFGERAGRWALLFQATSVVSITYCSRVLSETLFTLAMVGLASLLAEEWSTQRRRPAVGALAVGVLVAVSSYVRAIGGPLVVLVVAGFLATRRWRAALTAGAAAVVLLLPWHLRNRAQTGFAGFSTVAAVNSYRYNACMLLAEQNGIPFAEQQARIDAEFSALADARAVAEFARREGWRAIASRPARYAVLHLRTIPRNLFPAVGDLLQTFGVRVGGSGTLAVLQTQGLVAAVRHYFSGRWAWAVAVLPCVLWLGLVCGLAAVGGWMLIREHWRQPAVWLTGLAALYFLVAPGGAAHPRFGVPLMPLISVLAAGGLSRLLWRRGEGRRSSATAT